MPWPLNEAWLVGSHVYFARAGDTYGSAQIVSKTSKPPASDVTGVWHKFGNVEAADVSNTADMKEAFGPMPGQLVRTDIIPSKRKMDFGFTINQVDYEALEVVFTGQKLTPASTQFNPLAGAPKFGWLKLQQYQADNTIRLVVDAWGLLEPDGNITFGDDIVRPKFKFSMVHSTLQTAGDGT